MEDTKCICNSCGKTVDYIEVQPHICPYKADIDDDYQTLCSCCNECKTECAESI